MYDLHQPTKKLDQSEYSKIFAFLPIEPKPVANTYTKQILQAYESEQEFFPTQQSPQSGSGNPKRQKDKRKQRRNQKMGSLLLLREKSWSNFIQKTSLLLVAQSDLIHAEKSQWLK